MSGDERDPSSQHEPWRQQVTVLDSLGEAVIAFDTGGRITVWNRAAERLWGYARSEVLGRLSTEVIEVQGVHREQLREALARGESFTLPGRIQRKDGSWLDVEGTTVPVRDESERIVGFSTITRDVGERVALQRALERRTQELERANRELDGFSYSVSHDLRAPLRAIDGFSRLLLEEHREQLDDEGRRLLEVIRRNTQRMGQLIDDLLAFSRLGRQPLQRATVDMAALARSAADEVLAQEPGREVEIRYGHLPVAEGDAALMRQVWVNLLSNAVKYTRPSRPALIEVSGRSDDAEHSYSVQDNGVGFEMQYVGKLFGVFQRLHPSAQFEGTGVGLALVQRVVDRHGGRVWADGEVGRGATFGFALPRKVNRGD